MKNPTNPKNIWHADKPVVFLVNIDDIDAYYNISLNIRHAYNYQYKNLWLFIKQYLMLENTTRQLKLYSHRWTNLEWKLSWGYM